ncbi:MAG: YihY family inner membrane protein [Usitatibacter sp.]
MLRKLADTFGFLLFVLRRSREDRCPQIAGSLTYTTLLALVPIFTVVVALLSSTPFFGEVMAKIKLFLHMNLLPDIADHITNVYMREFSRNARRLTAVGVGGVFVVAVWMMLIMDRSLNAIWRARQSRPLWMSVLGYMAVVVIGPVLLVVSVTVTTYIMSLSRDVTVSSAFHVLLRVVPLAMSSLAFFMVYTIIPHRHVPWRHAALGGFVAAVLFESAKELFAFYVHISPTYNLVYGAFAAVPIFLIWIYISWMVILFGAELTASASYWRDARWKQAPMPAVKLRELLAVTQALLEGPASFGELRERTALPAEELDEVLAQMAQGAVVRRSGRSGYALTAATREVLATQPAAVEAPVSSRKRRKGRSARSSR